MGQSPRYEVFVNSQGNHVLDTAKRKLVAGPFGLRINAQKACDKRNAEEAQRIADELKSLK